MVSVNRIFQGRVVDLRIEEVVLPNGVTAAFEVVRHSGAAALVPIGDDGSVTLVRQFRHAAGGFILEIPAGLLEPGEEPEQCAARELREETGLISADLLPLGSILTAPGFCDERVHIFLARDLSPAEQQLERDEVLSVERIPIKQALDKIADGEIQDAKSIAGLYLALRHLPASLFELPPVRC